MGGFTVIPQLEEVSSFELTPPKPFECFVQIGDVRLDLAGYAGFNVDMTPLERGGSPTVMIKFFPATPDQLTEVSGKLLQMVRTEWNNELARLAALDRIDI